MNYLYIFDYSIAAIYKIELNEEDLNKNTDDILYELGLNPDECNYMYCDKELSIITLTK